MRYYIILLVAILSVCSVYSAEPVYVITKDGAIVTYNDGKQEYKLHVKHPINTEEIDKWVESKRNSKVSKIGQDVVTYQIRDVGYNRTHNCPQCGKQQLIQSGSAGRGMHYHTCQYDGTRWYH